MPTIVPHWVYRSGRYIVDRNNRLGMVSQTWVTTDPPTADPDEPARVLAATQGIFAFSGTGLQRWNLDTWRPFLIQLWPTRKLFTEFVLTPNSVAKPLLATAPEAAFRLQRVGVGSPPKLGRVAWPIFTDDEFSDLPRRRRIKSSVTLPPAWNDPSYVGLYRGIVYPRTFYNCIYHRRTNSWTLVTHYRLEPSVQRRWQRLRPFTHTGDPVPSRLWVVPELTHLWV